MFRKLLVLSIWCLIGFVSIGFGQKTREVEQESEDKTRPSAPVQSPPPAAAPTNSSSSSSSSNNSSNSNNSGSSGSSSGNGSNSRNTSPSNGDSDRRAKNRDRDRDRDPGSDPLRPSKPPKEDPEGKRPQKPKKPENPPTNPPTDPPIVTPNPGTNPPVGDGNQGKPRDDDKRRDRDRDRNRRNGGIWGSGYPNSTNYPTNYPASQPTFSWHRYFNENDVFFNIYDFYIDSEEANYSPFFKPLAGTNLEPLYYAYGREFFEYEFQFAADDWMIYYEPDLDDVFVDFKEFGSVKYERMVWFAVGDTIKAVNRKYKYKGQTVRPVLVETLPQLTQDKLYSFNVHDLPKGEYEMRFIARDGSTLKHFIRLK